MIAAVGVGVEPDMLTFTPDGKQILVCNEGEPSSDYKIDPEGTVSLIDVSGDISLLSQEQVKTIDFRSFTMQRFNKSGAFTIKHSTNASVSSKHVGGAQIVLADGSVKFIGNNIDQNTYVDLALITDGNVIGEY